MQVNGIVVSTGVAFGQALNISTHPQPLDLRLLPIANIAFEKDAIKQAIAQLIRYLQDCQQRVCPSCDTFQLIDADILLLEDESLLKDMQQHVEQYRVGAAVAVERIFNEQALAIAGIDDPYLANRSQDILLLAKRLITTLQGKSQHDLSNLTENTILLADDLTPADFAMLPLKFIKGIVLESGGLTSHTAILARSAGIPTLLNCPWSSQDGHIDDGASLILDAIEGVLYIHPDIDVQTSLKHKLADHLKHQQALLVYKDKPCLTLDGHALTLRANVGNLSDISSLMLVGAEGIGLFRTEFLLMNAQALPDEDQQYKLYCDALQALNGQTFTIRTFDVGADKDIPCLNQHTEENPALGVRGIRYSLLNPDMFIAQIKAILRAACHGDIRLMFPMVSQIEELLQAFELIKQAKQQLAEQGKKIGNVEYGIVVETPAAVLALESMLPYLDFVSIGSNDLTQYTLAADRTNLKLANLYPPLSPAVLTLIAMTIEKCQRVKVKVCLCGELASNANVLPLLMGMGLNELSINPASLLAVKARIVEGNYSAFYQHAQTVKQLISNAAIDEAIKTFNLNHKSRFDH